MFKAHPWKRILQDQDGPPAPADVETPKDGPGAKATGDGLFHDYLFTAFISIF